MAVSLAAIALIAIVVVVLAIRRNRPTLIVNSPGTTSHHGEELVAPADTPNRDDVRHSVEAGADVGNVEPNPIQRLYQELLSQEVAIRFPSLRVQAEPARAEMKTERPIRALAAAAADLSTQFSIVENLIETHMQEAMIRVLPRVPFAGVDLSVLNVFVSYKSEDWDFASRLATGLQSVGFQVTLVPPSSSSDLLSAAQIRARLSDLISGADYLCLVASELSLRSAWVHFEYKEAAETVGRLVYVCPSKLFDAGAVLDETFDWGELSHAVLVKHVICECTDFGANTLRKVAAQVIADPGEGWCDGRAGMAPWSSRDLRVESVMRKHARRRVLQDPAVKKAFVNRMILDVLPFTWEEAGGDEGYPDDAAFERAFKWLIDNFGRLKLEKALSRGEVDVAHIWYWAIGDEVMSSDPIERVDAFVVLSSRA